MKNSRICYFYLVKLLYKVYRTNIMKTLPKSLHVINWGSLFSVSSGPFLRSPTEFEMTLVFQWNYNEILTIPADVNELMISTGS